LSTIELKDEKFLLQQVAEGDEIAFKALFDLYREKLYYYISRFIKSEQVAEELVMDVFMKIWIGRDLIVNILNFDSFLFRVAHNKSIDFLRSAAKDKNLKELLWNEIQLASYSRADDLVLVKEFEEKTREAINLLAPQRKKIYQLSREEDITHEEIAKMLQISKATVNNQIVEARKFIRNHLSKHFDLAFLILMVEKF